MKTFIYIWFFAFFLIFTQESFAQQEEPVSIVEPIATQVFVIKDTLGRWGVKIPQKSFPQQEKAGGITKTAADFADYTIPLSSLSLSEEGQYSISAQNHSLPACAQVSFEFSEEKVLLPKIQDHFHLQTATRCVYEVFESEKKKVASFALLFNLTYQDWCHHPDQSLAAYQTARALSPFCQITEKEQYFSLRNTNIVDLSPFGSFFHAKFLILDSNKIRDLQQGLFDYLVDLRWVFLDNNEIKKIPDHFFNKQEKLQFLFLQQNQISNLTRYVFYKLNNIEWISLFQNKIEKIEKGTFENLSNLESLELSFNELTQFPQDISELSNLISFEISNNKITEIPEDAFMKLKKISNLDLSENLISCYPENLILNNKNLHFFNKSENIGNINSNICK
jgi:Leucine-rich repeat (LRR) protein